MNFYLSNGFDFHKQIWISKPLIDVFAPLAASPKKIKLFVYFPICRSVCVAVC